MKKLLVVFVLALLILQPLSGLAYDEEITFRGIPFGSTYPEVIERLEGEGLVFSKVEDDVFCSPFNKTIEGSYRGVGFYTYTRNGIENVMPAGYMLNYVDLNFMYYYDENGYSSALEDSTLYRARYDILVVDYDSAFADLKQKLSNLYGEGELFSKIEEHKYSDYDDHITFCVWRGLNDTAVALYRKQKVSRSDGSTLDDLLCIDYGLYNAFEKTVQLEAAKITLAKRLEEEAREANKDNYNGL